MDGETVKQRLPYPIGDGGELTEHHCSPSSPNVVRRYGRRGRLSLDADAEAQSLLIAELEKFTGVGEDA